MSEARYEFGSLFLTPIYIRIGLLSSNMFSVFCLTVLHIHRFMQQLEDLLNIGLCGHFLVELATMCFSAFSALTVRYNNCFV
jgi:hypothetical protein